jgi:hypothetical protein
MRGRRRVGKSHLLDRAFAGHRLVHFQADEDMQRSICSRVALRSALIEQAGAERVRLIPADELFRCAAGRLAGSAPQRPWLLSAASGPSRVRAAMIDRLPKSAQTSR